MQRRFEEELEELRNKLLRMAALAEASVSSAMAALVDSDSAVAQRVIDSDDEINRLEVEIDNFCVELLARRQPMASDLRFIASAMKINNDLERIGDHGVNIAERTVELLKEPRIKPLVDLPRLAAIAQHMVKNALDAFVQHDAEIALQVCRRDDEVDNLNDQIIRALLTYMMNDPKTIARALSLIIISKNLERVADLATNIAEEVIYILEARTIKHHLEKTDSD
jgi:phosphate transport system protein